MKNLNDRQPQPKLNAMMGRVKKIHFVGIGGAGMSGIAEVLCNMGYSVSGSDMKASPVIERLQKLGATVYLTHEASNVEGVDAVVISTAINLKNPEIVAAELAHIPVVRRAEMLAELMRFSFGIAVAGTHGKTTTTSLVASLLAQGNLDPTFVIGGLLNSAGTNAKLGDSDYLVAEADESDASFLHLQPMMSIVTNIDRDHMETYGGDFDRLRQTFVEFLQHLPFYGLAILCIDDPEVRHLLRHFSRPFRTYGLNADADVRAIDVVQKGAKTHFSVQLKGGRLIADLTLNMPGEHNVLNALAAVSVALELDVSDQDIAQGLAEFQGIGRRFHITENCQIGGKQVLLVDDYAHHPREVQATLDAAKLAWPGKRLVLMFQPHRFSRTKEQFDDFVQVLSGVDCLLLNEVYPAGETPIAGADGRALCGAIRTRGQVVPVFVEVIGDVPNVLADMVLDDDVVLVLGAGDVGGMVAGLREAGIS